MICLHTSVRLQRDITHDILSIALRLKLRADLDHAVFFRVCHRNIAIDHGLDGKLQLVRTILYQNAALDGSVLVGALHRKGTELIVLSLQIHTFGADYRDLWCFDTRCLVLCLVLDDIAKFRSQRYIFACGEQRTFRLCQSAFRCQGNAAVSSEISAVGKGTVLKEIGDRDIPCHIPIDSDSQSFGIVPYTHIPVNGRLFH